MGTDMSQNGCYLYMGIFFLMQKKVLESCVDISHYLHVLVAPQRWATNCWEVMLWQDTYLNLPPNAFITR